MKQALKYKVEVGTAGEVIVLVRESDTESDALLKASESTLGSWDNPVHDEVLHKA